MARILVYADGGIGASEACVSMTIRELRRALATMRQGVVEADNYRVETSNAGAIRSGDLSKNCRLLVMPGGRDLPYCSLLNGPGNDSIRSFVGKGGSYLGICAGAYYASSRLDFSPGDPDLQVSGSRELALFPGVARGPVFPGFCYKDNSGARICSISLSISGSSLPVYYNGGCYFCRYEETTNVKVLATYEKTIDFGVPLPDGPDRLPDAPVAVVSMQYGTGKVILSGVHIESSPTSLTKVYSGDTHVSNLAEKLRPTEHNRKIFFNTIIKDLL